MAISPKLQLIQLQELNINKRMKKQNHITSEFEKRVGSVLVTSGRVQKQSCLQFGKNDTEQMIDYTFCDKKKDDGVDSTGDLSEKSDWGFPRPCEQRNQSSILFQIFHFQENVKNTSPLQQAILEQAFQPKSMSQDSNQLSRSLCVGSQKQKIQQSPQKRPLAQTIRRIKRTRRVKKEKKVKKLKRKMIRKQKPKTKKETDLEKKEKNKYKNQTKNTVKNFGKAFVIFVNDNRALIERILHHCVSDLSYEQLNTDLQKKKKSITGISHLRELWNGKEMRVISEHFLRKYCPHYTFNSKVQDYRSFLKYRTRLQYIVAHPNEQINLKFN